MKCYELAEQVFDRFKPEVLLTYGGHPASLELMRRAPRVAGAECPSRRAWTSPRHSCGVAALPPQPLSRLLGLDGPVIPDPIPFDRIVADNPEPQYFTFINPQPSKGMAFLRRSPSFSTSADRTSLCWWWKAAARPTPWRGWRSISPA